VCVGFESPIDEDLKAMDKGYTSNDMIKWSRVLRRYFWVHGMFIFGYPHKQKSALSIRAMAKRFRIFIRKAKISSIQILRPVPLVGTRFRKRLEKAGRIPPLDVVRWGCYDGSWVCFISDDVDEAELQEYPLELMSQFYPSGRIRIVLRTLSFPIHYLITGWDPWYYRWWRQIVRHGAHGIIKRWREQHDTKGHLDRLARFKKRTRQS
jgi:radical SAM superfamily enzyme YgiQ (UPF0313 family)